MANQQLDKNSAAAKKKLEAHVFTGEDGEEYGASTFGNFGEYFRRKKVKLQNEDEMMRQTVPEKSRIFKGVAAHVASYTQPPVEELRRLLVLNGGIYIKYLDFKTMATHIIASTLPPKKADDWRHLRIVRPAWVVDSIAAGKLLPWYEYSLLGHGPNQQRIQFQAGRLGVQAGRANQMAGYLEQEQHSVYAKEMQRLSEKNQPLQSPFDAMDDLMGDAEEAAGDLASPEASKQKEMTSEEHNAWLLSDPNIRKTSAANPDFVKQFYSESRLHHLSTWKAQLKSKMQRLAAEKAAAEAAASAVSSAKKSRQRRKPGARQYIFHVDFDSFFCAVSLKSAPEYVDKPAAVAHSSGSSSEIASCNYPARKFGVRNGMWMKQATELCPDLKVLPYDFPAYEEASQLFYESILEIQGGIVQSVSVDEALVDATSLVLSRARSDSHDSHDSPVRPDEEESKRREQQAADDIAARLRQRVRERTGCHVSVGIGANILLAKVALRRAKPAGQFQVRPEEVLEVLDGLRVEQLPGVARSIGGRLEEMGVRLVSDLRKMSRERLTGVLGPKTGGRLWEQARGIDHAEVGDQPVRKSVSAEINWGIRFTSQDEAEEFLVNLCGELERRLLNEQVRGRSLTLKVLRRSADAPLDAEKHLGHGRCDTFNRSTVFGVATHQTERIGKEAVSMLRSFHISPGDLRGMGVQMQKLEPLKGPPQTGDATDAWPADGSQPRISFGNGQSPSKNQKKPSPTMPSTQFVLPRDVDPSVLAALPLEIRQRLVAEQNDSNASHASNSNSSSSSNTAQLPSKIQEEKSPANKRIEYDIPPGIDLEVLEALPEEMRAEVLAEYRERHQRPQPSSPSPRKGDSIAKRKKSETGPAARSEIRTSSRGRRGRKPGSGRLAAARVAAASSRKHRNFFVAASAESTEHAPELLEEPDPEVLAALPSDIRAEVLEDYERRRGAAQQKTQAAQSKISERGEKWQRPPEDRGPMLQLPEPPPKAQFQAAEASQGSSAAAHVLSLQEAKSMIKRWHMATRDEGPHEADVAMLEQFLVDIVTQEKNMDKARKLVVWMEWLVADQTSAAEAAGGEGRESWQLAVARVKAGVQEAMRMRRLGPMQFS